MKSHDPAAKRKWVWSTDRKVTEEGKRRRRPSGVPCEGVRCEGVRSEGVSVCVRSEGVKSERV